MVWLEIAAPFGQARERKDGWRDEDPALDPERGWKSDRSGMLSTGGRNVVEHEPDTAELERVLVLAIDHIVRIEPVGDCVPDCSCTVTERSKTPLNIS